MVNPGNPHGTWTFGTDQYFNPARPELQLHAAAGAIQFTASLPAFFPSRISHTYEAYVQDTWRPRPNLTLNLGLRYDLQTKIWNEDFDQSRYPRPLPYVDFAVARRQQQHRAARSGLPGICGNDGRSVVRAGYGVVYSNMQNTLVRRRDQRLPAVHRSTSAIRPIRIRTRAATRCRSCRRRRRTSPSWPTTSRTHRRTPPASAFSRAIGAQHGAARRRGLHAN